MLGFFGTHSWLSYNLLEHLRTGEKAGEEEKLTVCLNMFNLLFLQKSCLL